MASESESEFQASAFTIKSHDKSICITFTGKKKTSITITIDRFKISRLIAELIDVAYRKPIEQIEKAINEKRNK